MKEYKVKILNIFNRIKCIDGYIVLKAACFVRTDDLDINKINVKVDNKQFNCNIKFFFQRGIPFWKKYRLNFYTLKIDISSIIKNQDDDFDNRLCLMYNEHDCGKIKYSLFRPKRGGRVGKAIKLPNKRLLYLKRSIYGNFYLKHKTNRVPIPLLINIFKKINNKNGKLIVKAFCLVKIICSKEKINFNGFKLNISDGGEGFYEKNIFFRFKKGIPFLKGYIFNCYSFELDIDDILKFDIQNKLIVNYMDKYFGRIVYSAFDLKKGHYRTSKIININNLSIYLRQTIANTMYLTIREKNVFDSNKGKFLLIKARMLSLITHNSNIILMYEKECDKYEESASVLYERLIDLGYKNVYYVLNKNNKKYSTIKEKYKANIINKNSLKHLVYFFKCKKFIGTETLGHAIQLRASNPCIVKKINSHNNKYVFLQHGVMYMVSLDADMRSGFRNNNFKLYRVVVSSQLEKKHFIELGGFEDEELYVTGLAKFDKSVRNDDASKIVIMPTWRRWETNQASQDFSKTKYYKMIKKIVDKVPGEYKNNIIVLPHPLMKKVIKNSKNELSKYMVPDDTSYDDVLKTCCLLITDYSSIAFDAFYRGSNVIFYWEEKEECLKHYGGDAKLMLNNENVFGDVCMNDENLEQIIEKNYKNTQEKLYKKRYKKIVEFDDGKNCDRIIECLKKDKMI